MYQNTLASPLNGVKWSLPFVASQLFPIVRSFTKTSSKTLNLELTYVDNPNEF